MIHLPERVINAKASHPEITLLLLTPYRPAERPVDLRKGFDNSYYPFEGKTPPRRVAIVKANDIMIHSCDYLIAYAWHPASNARDLVEKALRLEKQGGIKVENLAEDRLRSRLDGRGPDSSLQSNPRSVLEMSHLHRTSQTRPLFTQYCHRRNSHAGPL